MKINVVIPAGNEKNIEVYQRIYHSFEGQVDVELIWVSANLVLNQWLGTKDQLIVADQGPNRAYRLNRGIEVANSDFVILHHPRSVLELGAIRKVREVFRLNQRAWGGFTHRFFGSNHYLLRFTSWYSNKIRFDIKGIIYLDHCFFFNKSLFKGPHWVPQVDIFEDTLLSDKLNRLGPPLRINCFSDTSAVRFNKNGVWQQALMNQKLKLAYLFKTSSPEVMNEEYEKDLWLN